jgi:hypothetical protein
MGFSIASLVIPILITPKATSSASVRNTNATFFTHAGNL